MLLVLLLSVSILLALGQITLGGVVRVTGSGDGCPDWPLCFGRLVPPWNDFHALLEWSHRATGTLLGVSLVAALIRAWRGPASSSLTLTLAGILVLVAIIGGIGGAVVLSELDPTIRMAHLMLAQISVMGMLFVMAAASNWTALPGKDSLNDLSPILIWASGIALIALLTGAFAVMRGAGTACQSWPLCNGLEFPRSELEAIQLLHRAASGVSALAALYALYKTIKIWNRPAWRVVAWVAVAAVIGQIFIGAANPWTDFGVWSRAAHLSLATVVWALLTLMTARSWRIKAPR